MMVQLIDNLVGGLQKDFERRIEEQTLRKKSETQLCKLLEEMLETEKKYVEDLEKACHDYLPLTKEKSHKKLELRRKHSESSWASGSQESSEEESVVSQTE